MTDRNDLIARLSELQARITPGPWEAKVEPMSYPECDDQDFPAVVRGPSNIEIAYLSERYNEGLTQANDVDAEFIALVRNELDAIIAALQSAEAMREAAWRDGFQSARNCLPDDEAFCLTEDVEEDCWLDSKTRLGDSHG